MSGEGSNIFPLSEVQKVASEIMGPFLVGALLNMAMYGASFVQTYIYIRSCTNDPWWRKVMVAVLLLLITTHAILIDCAVWMYLIRHAGDLIYMLIPVGPFAGSVIVGGFTTGICQIFFGWRVWHVSRNWLFGVFVLVGALTQTALTIVVTVNTNKANNFALENQRDIRGPAIAYAVLAVLVDSCNAGALAWSLRGRKGMFKHTNDLLSSISILSIQTNAITALWALLALITFLAIKNSTEFVFIITLPNLYYNCLMASLNARLIWGDGPANAGSTANHHSSDSTSSRIATTIKAIRVRVAKPGDRRRRQQEKDQESTRVSGEGRSPPHSGGGPRGGVGIETMTETMIGGQTMLDHEGDDDGMDFHNLDDSAPGSASARFRSFPSDEEKKAEIVDSDGSPDSGVYGMREKEKYSATTDSSGFDTASSTAKTGLTPSTAGNTGGHVRFLPSGGNFPDSPLSSPDEMEEDGVRMSAGQDTFTQPARSSANSQLVSAPLGGAKPPIMLAVPPEAHYHHHAHQSAPAAMSSDESIPSKASAASFLPSMEPSPIPDSPQPTSPTGTTENGQRRSIAGQMRPLPTAPAFPPALHHHNSTTGAGIAQPERVSNPPVLPEVKRATPMTLSEMRMDSASERPHAETPALPTSASSGAFREQAAAYPIPATPQGLYEDEERSPDVPGIHVSSSKSPSSGVFPSSPL